MTAARFFPPAAPGSLFKCASVKPRKVKDGQRVRDEKHLAAIRKLPCCACGIDPGGEAAHIRMTRAGKPITGIGLKPSDEFCLPLCHDEHMQQHAQGEVLFWEQVGIDPLRMAANLFALSPDIDKMRATVLNSFATRE